MEPSPVSWAKPPFFAPLFSARTAFPDNAPKLIAEMLKTLASYGRVQLALSPILTRKSWDVSSVGASE